MIQGLFARQWRIQNAIEEQYQTRQMFFLISSWGLIKRNHFLMFMSRYILSVKFCLHHLLILHNFFLYIVCYTKAQRGIVLIG